MTEPGLYVCDHGCWDVVDLDRDSVPLSIPCAFHGHSEMRHVSYDALIARAALSTPPEGPPKGDSG